MRVQLAQQAKEILGQSDLVIITERVDDVALLIGQMVKMGLPEVLDRHIPRHWTQRGISWGWTAVVWLAYIVTEGDPRKVSVEAYLKGMHHTLSRLTAQVIEPLDFSDDRLSHLLKHLSKPAYWHQIEHDLNARSIEVYDLSQGVIRCDATTVSGEHEVTAGGLLQLGHSKDDPTRPQIKVMMGSLDPLGMPLATDVLSGERADDGLYIPIIERIQSGLNKTGLLFVGDCKMSALDTRAYLARHQDWYLSPLPLTGAPAEAMDTWITVGVTKSEAGELTRIWRTTDRGHEVLAAEGYEFERSCAAPGATGDTATWNERGGGYAPLCMRTNRPRGWKNVCAKRRQNWRPSRLLEGGGNGKSLLKRRSWRPLLSCSRSIGWTAYSTWPGKSRSSRPPNTWAEVEGRCTVKNG